ncbi:LAQU0S28e00342g1_1 [Lachancea quebecensis]|uniref:Acyl-protein thioesterase 1 n=1 Tax=Lachancea quebecensis TaxID=1654605 RepID=A0A0P1KY50_9SACH|nr:LAQU0S28e00342g1_1 [Lachancea quebecensis]
MSAINAIRIASKTQPAKQSLIFLHGLGDTGSGWSFLAEQLQRDPAFRNTSFIFPNAPVMGVTANGNDPTTAWFDIHSWDNVQLQPDESGFLKSLNVIEKLVGEQIQNGVDPQNIVVGGFSQGAALALASAATLPTKIAGFVSLSGFPMINDKLLEIKNATNSDTPVFHGHGDQDTIVPLNDGQSAKQFFTKRCGVSNYTLNIYPGMGHSACPEEIDDLVKFFKKVLRLN